MGSDPPRIDRTRGPTPSAGGDLGAGWRIVVLHHTECGIAKVAGRPELLAPFFGVEQDELAARAVDDPRAAVAFDVGAVRAETRLGDGIRVSGLVYDVSTGLVESRTNIPRRRGISRSRSARVPSGQPGSCRDLSCDRLPG